jgi:hypothetical protein
MGGAIPLSISPESSRTRYVGGLVGFTSAICPVSSDHLGK